MELESAASSEVVRQGTAGVEGNVGDNDECMGDVKIVTDSSIDAIEAVSDAFESTCFGLREAGFKIEIPSVPNTLLADFRLDCAFVATMGGGTSVIGVVGLLLCFPLAHHVPIQSPIDGSRGLDIGGIAASRISPEA